MEEDQKEGSQTSQEKTDEAVSTEDKKSEIEEVDNRSIYVGNVDYSASTEELRAFFKECGDIERVTIPRNPMSKQPKGFAYIEFADPTAVLKAQSYNDKTFKGRKLKVMPKRTNIPGKSHNFRAPRFHPRRRFRFRPYYY